MSRKITVLVLLTFLAARAFAAHRVNVDQLEQILFTGKGKPDMALAQQLSDLELTERLSSTRLARWQAVFSGGVTEKTLQTLADQSAFLEPPAAEIPSMPAPDIGNQRRIMGLVVAYVGKTIPQLPNFFATRNTTRFEDTPQLETRAGLIPYRPLHAVGDSTAIVLYRDGREITDVGAAKNKKQPAAPGLDTWGVFGPILSTVMVDAAQSKLAFSHWEQGPTGTQAVFSFSVPKEKSHYEVNYCCVAAEAGSAAANIYPFHRIAGYHGEMAVDPATGTILRLAVQADLKTTDPVANADIEVEYAAVEIGGKSYFCPVRSVSRTVAQSVQVDPVYHFPLANQLQPLKISLNDVVFDQYHLFRADAKVLTAEETVLAASLPPVSSAGSKAVREAAHGQSATTTALVRPPESNRSVPQEAEASNASTIAPVLAPSPVPVSEPPATEITVTAAGELPDELPKAPANSSRAAGGFTLRTSARLVDIGMVALDKKGHPVTNLKPEDFEVDDQGRRQEIKFFSQAGSGKDAEGPANNSPSALNLTEFSNQRGATPVAKSPAVEVDRGATVLLIDGGNLAFGDLSHAREEMLRFLKRLEADQPVGLYILKSYGFQVLLEPNTDHAGLAAQLARWMPTAQDLAHAQDEEQRNRQQFDSVHSVYDLPNVNGNAGNPVESTISGSGAQAKAAAMPTDAKLQEMGNNPGRATLSLLARVARHLAAIPGHKSLVWVTSDNVLADWSGQAAARQEKGSKSIDVESIRAREAMNEAHVSVYPLDASQLEAGGIGADIGTRNVLPVGVSDRDKAMAGMGDATPGMKPGRVTAQMQQDLHPIDGSYRDLAEATGGRALRRAGDIAAELDGIVADGRATYLLSFSPDAPADDKYHDLTVKVISRRDITLHYRTGYLYTREPESIKERFRQAIWQAADASEIRIGANLVPKSDGSSLQLNIATTDLSLAQQGGFWTDKLDVFLVFRDDSALHAEVSGETMGLRLQPAAYERVLREGVPFEQQLGARRDAGSIRILVVDENSGRIGSVTVPAGALGK